MKYKKFILGLLLAGFSSASARTWTSSNGEDTFEGNLKSFDAETGNVTVLVNGRTISFSKDKLSETDHEFLTEWKVKQETVVAEPGKDSLFAHLNKAGLRQLEGKRFRRTKLETQPEYYILYFSASW